MKKYQIVIDTNILVTALRSDKGASFKFLSMIDSNKFELNLSVTLLAEYEDVLKRKTHDFGLTHFEIDDILDYFCFISNKRPIFYLWRPYLKDVKDDMVLELAVASSADFIVTYNAKDFMGIEKFGIKIITPKEFLKIIGELK